MMMSNAASKRVLVTGSSGVVGTAVCRELVARGHFVRGFDLAGPAGDMSLSDVHVGDLTDAKAVHDAAAGMDTIIHLAAFPDDADFVEKLVAPNVVGLYHVCEAARQQGVRRLILTSTVQTVWKLGVDHREVKLEDGTEPVNHYALTKVYAEHMGEMYARMLGLSVLSVRLGWVLRKSDHFKRSDSNALSRAIYLSHRDVGRAFACAVDAANPKPGRSAIVFFSSLHDRSMGMDPTPAREVIGFEAKDTWPEGTDDSVWAAE